MPKYNIKMAIDDNSEGTSPANIEVFIKATFQESEIEILNLSIEEVK